MQKTKTVYHVKNIFTKKISRWSLNTILKEINRDRSDSFLKYNRLDWRDGLESMTEYTLIKKTSIVYK